MISYWDFLNIVYDYSSEVREIKKLSDGYNQDFYKHPLAKHGGGMTSFDINSNIAKWLIKYQKTGKANTRLINYILLEIKEEIEKVEKENLWEESKKQKNNTKKQKGYIYLIKSKNFYKIGRALQLQSRIETYRTENPFGIKVIFQKKVNDYIGKEIGLLEKFKEKNHRGEWFKLDKEDINWIKENI